MKDGIHPKYVECTITCSCGATVVTQSVKPAIRVEICSNCHPFYTQQERFVDTAGRVEKFRQKYSGAKKSKAAAPETPAVPAQS